MALPYHLYVISTSGTDMEAQLPLAYGTALVLIMIILLVNLGTIKFLCKCDDIPTLTECKVIPLVTFCIHLERCFRFFP